MIAVDVTYPPRDAAPVEDFTDLLYQAFHIQAARITAWELERADLVIRPSIPPTTETYTDRDREMLIAAGQQGARAMNGRLAELAQAWRAMRSTTLHATQPLVQLHRQQDRERHAEQPRP